MYNKKSLSVFKLINTYFFKNKIGLIFSIVFPFLFMLIFYIIALSIGNKTIDLVNGEQFTKKGLSYFADNLPAYTTLTICPLSMLCLPIMNIEFRNSILLKKVKSSNISKYEYNAIVFGYFILMSTIVTLMMFLFFFLFLINNFDLFSHFNWWSIIFGVISLIIITVTFSMFTSTFIKSSFSCQMLNVGIILISLVLSGQFIPTQLLSQVEAIKYINLLSPIGYSQTLINIGAGNPFSGMIGTEYINSTNDIFNWLTPFYFKQYVVAKSTIIPTIDIPIKILYQPTGIPVYAQWEKIVSVILPFFLSAGFAGTASYFFKWSNR